MLTRRTFLRDASLISAASLTSASTRAAAALDLRLFQNAAVLLDDVGKCHSKMSLGRLRPRELAELLSIPAGRWGVGRENRSLVDFVEITKQKRKN
jgi:hypothetical protein